MAENIYSKGTRAYFEDKELAWISAEVTSVAKSGDAVKLVFTDERGKVSALGLVIRLVINCVCRKSSSILPPKTYGMVKTVFRPCEILRFSKPPMILLHFRI
jgi:hypothetical protein